MNIVSAEKISKSYNEKNLFNEVSVSIEGGDKIGLIGINGTGKSTFLKAIAGLETLDAGKITYTNGITIEFLPQNPCFEDGTTVLQQVFKGFSPVMKLLRDYETVLRKINQHPEDSRLEKELIALTQKMENMGAWTIETEAKSVLTRLGISDFYQNVETLSGGQRKRVALAGALITPSDLLILDEPTNHIDSETVDWLEKYLAKRTGALLMVTHDRYFLDRVVNRILEIDRGFLYSYQANYEKYLEMKLEREEIAQASERKRQDLIRNELKWIQRGARARTTKQKARLGRFEKLTEQEGLRESENIDIQAAISRLGKKIIHLENISKRFPCGEIIRDFSYSFLKDDRVGIIGPNGSGKSTLLKIMTGQISPDNGSVSIGQTVKTGFFSQENDDMDEGLRVIEYIRKKAEYINTRDGTISASQMLERFLFPPNVQWTPIAKLSGGEKRRLYLLYILMGAPNVLMLDEPTNDLDIQTLTVLENYLDDFPGVVIVVSHDRYFLDRVADKIFSFEGNGEVRQYAGNYTDYRQYAEQLQQSAADQSRETEKQNRNEKREVKKDRPLKFTYREQKEFEQIDGIIEALEKKLQRITLEMNDASSDFQKLQQLVAEKDGVEKQLEDAIERWTYLNELYEKIEGR
ncbi:MAG: ABC-F family ATP-binding cassette domain-containing protein [Clostridiaceae bacterium]|jgi:ATP-binding cassette subfamily F protein uup|nr:ABC-F family ATP-binding cassette domain-containing protein [Clostridiaceae bacterium]